MPHSKNYNLAKDAKSQADKTKQSQKHDQISLYEISQAVENILKDYETTAKTLDTLTQAISEHPDFEISSTDHASNVQTLKNELLTELKTQNPPWIQAGYDSRQAWLDDQ